MSDFAVLVFALGVQVDFLSALFFHFRPVLLSHGNANKKLKKTFLITTDGGAKSAERGVGGLVWGSRLGLHWNIFN